MPIGWVAAATVLSAGISATSAEDAEDAQYAQTQAQKEAEAAKLEFAKEQWKYFTDTYGGLEQDLVAEVSKPLGLPDYAGVEGRAAADVTQSFASRRDATNRDLQRYGINPNSGRYAGIQRLNDMTETALKAGAMTTARRNEKTRMDVLGQNRIANMNNVLNAGKGSNAAAQGVINAYGDQTNMYAGLANQYGRQAQSYMNDAAEAIGAGAQIYGQYGQRRPTGSTTPPPNTQQPLLGPPGYARGGLVRDDADIDAIVDKHFTEEYGDSAGGLVRGGGTPTSDSVPAVIDGESPARLSTNEYVLNADTVEYFGLPMIEKMNQVGLAIRDAKRAPSNRPATGLTMPQSLRPLPTGER